MIAYLPNKEGHFKSVKIPKYIVEILENVSNDYDYTFTLRGVNPIRPAYGVEADLKKLESWVKRYHADFVVKKIVKQPKCYYGVFEMTDPVCFQLEKIGLLK